MLHEGSEEERNIERSEDQRMMTDGWKKTLLFYSPDAEWCWPWLTGNRRCLRTVWEPVEWAACLRTAIPRLGDRVLRSDDY